MNVLNKIVYMQNKYRDNIVDYSIIGVKINTGCDTCKNMLTVIHKLNLMKYLIPGLLEVAPEIPEQQLDPSGSAQLRTMPTLPTVVEPVEEDLCKKFKQQSCGCRKVPGKKPCSNMFSVEHYLELRAQCSFLTRDELDLVKYVITKCPPSSKQHSMPLYFLQLQHLLSLDSARDDLSSFATKTVK